MSDICVARHDTARHGSNGDTAHTSKTTDRQATVLIIYASKHSRHSGQAQYTASTTAQHRSTAHPEHSVNG